MKKFFRDMKKYRWYLLYAARSELRSEVAGSYLNWIWWILPTMPSPMSFFAAATFRLLRISSMMPTARFFSLARERIFWSSSREVQR